MVTCRTSPTVQYARAGCAVLFENFCSLFVIDARFTSSATSFLLFTCQDREVRWCELLRWEQQGSRGGVSASGCRSRAVRLCPIAAWYFPFLADRCFSAVGLIEDEVRLVCVCWSGSLVHAAHSVMFAQLTIVRLAASFVAGRVDATGPRTYGFDLFFILF